MKIYIVKSSSGQYDDSWVSNEKAFRTEDAAKDFINSRPKFNLEALQELYHLKWEYQGSITMEGHTDWSDEQWDEHEKEMAQLEVKAVSEIQDKYPDADLTVEQDFHGYTIEELELENN